MMIMMYLADVREKSVVTISVIRYNIFVEKEISIVVNVFCITSVVPILAITIEITIRRSVTSLFLASQLSVNSKFGKIHFALAERYADADIRWYFGSFMFLDKLVFIVPVGEARALVDTNQRQFPQRRREIQWNMAPMISYNL